MKILMYNLQKIDKEKRQEDGKVEKLPTPLLTLKGASNVNNLIITKEHVV